jgi:hypothetical protein
MLKMTSAHASPARAAFQTTMGSMTGRPVEVMAVPKIV